MTAVRRELAVLGAVLVLLVALVLVGLGVGEIPLSPLQVAGALVGHGDTVSDFVVGQLRGPRVAGAVLVGAALGAAGGIVQSVVRNPIASPDVIGITSGASAAGLTAIVLVGASGGVLFGSVVVGAVLVAVVIAALSWRRGITGNRVVLVGIGVAAICLSVTGWMLTAGTVQQAGTALLWLSGSLNAVDRTLVGILAVAVVVLLAAALAQSRRLTVLALGDEVAAALGLRPDRAKVLLLLTAVGLTAGAVATAGPVAFVALMAAPIARRLVGNGRVALGAVAAVGAVVTLASDLVAQFAIPGNALPVGVVTGVVGAPYLLWLLARGGRRRARPGHAWPFRARLVVPGVPGRPGTPGSPVPTRYRACPGKERAHGTGVAADGRRGAGRCRASRPSRGGVARRHPPSVGRGVGDGADRLDPAARAGIRAAATRCRTPLRDPAHNRPDPPYGCRRPARSLVPSSRPTGPPTAPDPTERWSGRNEGLPCPNRLPAHRCAVVSGGPSAGPVRSTPCTHAPPTASSCPDAWRSS